MTQFGLISQELECRLRPIIRSHRRGAHARIEYRSQVYDGWQLSEKARRRLRDFVIGYQTQQIERGRRSDWNLKRNQFEKDGGEFGVIPNDCAEMAVRTAIFVSGPHNHEEARPLGGGLDSDSEADGQRRLEAYRQGLSDLAPEWLGAPLSDFPAAEEKLDDD